MTRDDWPGATLGDTVRAGHSITVYCNSYSCQYRLEQGDQYRHTLSPADLVAYAERYGAGMTVIDFRKKLRCHHCGSGDVSTIVERPYVPAAERQ
jgi:hypothetical protein